ncbi:hypothetical protein IFU39_13780 [Paenibacillus sp. CFBP 13594]|uniref:hypothetical protein n=1 Tax=Paenibacillus sp. CFBP 13594 TaxID=2774037 RepID=UPI0017818774|nr:hypothetical protein [Paenibacillus sp. CFBP 13594]MBD8838886.1 hypothetical protein [Paenibacillus sp. CFBP 13594]
MILYHGTYEQKAKEILTSGKIKSSGIDRAYGSDDMNPTTDGYVYLTDKFGSGVYFGSRVIPTASSDKVVLFEVDVKEDQLEIDEDEITVMSIWPQIKESIDAAQPLTLLSSLAILHTVRVKRDLICGADVKRYVTLPSPYSVMQGDDEKEYEIRESVKALLDKRENATQEHIDRLFSIVKWKDITTV